MTDFKFLEKKSAENRINVLKTVMSTKKRTYWWNFFLY